MKDLLMTFGCSFTYGEGLEFHCLMDNYPDSFSLYKNRTNYYHTHSIFSSLYELVEFRESNKYSSLLKNFISCTLMSKAENGGCNYRNIEMMELYIEYLNKEKKFTPKYCVFQLTNIIRDVIEFSGNHSLLCDDAERWLGKELKAELIQNVSTLNDPLRDKKLNFIISKIFSILIDRINKNFIILESMGCKCTVFNGVEDEYSHHLVSEILLQNKFYMPIIFNRSEYRSWDHMNKENFLTLKKNIDVNDDHPCLDSHKWLANTLYKKYLELTK